MDNIDLYDKVLSEIIQVYNNLMNISTKGNDTKIMSSVMISLESVINQIDTSLKGIAPEYQVPPTEVKDDTECR